MSEYVNHDTNVPGPPPMALGLVLVEDDEGEVTVEADVEATAAYRTLEADGNEFGLPDFSDPDNARHQRTVTLPTFNATIEGAGQYFDSIPRAARWTYLVAQENPWDGISSVDLQVMADEFGIATSTAAEDIRAWNRTGLAEIHKWQGNRVHLTAKAPLGARRLFDAPTDTPGFPPGLLSLLREPSQIDGDASSHTVAARLMVYVSHRTQAAPDEASRRSDTAVARALGCTRAYVCSIRRELERDRWLYRLLREQHDGETRAPVTALEPHMEGEGGVRQQSPERVRDDGGGREQTDVAATHIYSYSIRELPPTTSYPQPSLTPFVRLGERSRCGRNSENSQSEYTRPHEAESRENCQLSFRDSPGTAENNSTTPEQGQRSSSSSEDQKRCRRRDGDHDATQPASTVEPDEVERGREDLLTLEDLEQMPPEDLLQVEPRQTTATIDLLRVLQQRARSGGQ